MKKLAALALAAFATTPAMAEDSPRFGPLLSAEELSAAQTTLEPLLIDIRAGEDFSAGHIVGSVSAPYGLFRGPKSNPGQLVSEADLQKTLRAIGVTKDRPTVVIYQGKDVTDFGAAARVYWTLKSSGVSQLAILNGGVDAWKATGLALEKGASTPTPSQIEVTFSAEWLATTDDVLGVVGGTTDATLLDARSEEFWSGLKQHPAAASAGTLPGSGYLPHSSFFSDGAPQMSGADSVQAIIAQAGLSGQSSGPIVSFCNTGHWAATSWFALSEVAGVEGVKLYPESMVGYSNAGHPLQNAPEG